MNSNKNTLDNCYIPQLPGENYYVPGNNHLSASCKNSDDEVIKITKYGYDYELWSEMAEGSTVAQGQSVLVIPPADVQAGKGGIFSGMWQDTRNVLIRSGKKYTDNKGNTKETGTPGKTHREIGEISIEFDTTWSSNDNLKILSVYGWAFYKPESIPKSFSNQIEYYIISEHGKHNSAKNGMNSIYKGEKIIDGILFEFYECDRINQPMLTGNGNFKQYFSVPKNAADFRTSGTVSVSEHFKAWEEAGMIMDGPFYEVSWMIESHTGPRQGAKGNVTVNKNILTIIPPVVSNI